MNGLRPVPLCIAMLRTTMAICKTYLYSNMCRSEAGWISWVIGSTAVLLMTHDMIGSTAVHSMTHDIKPASLAGTHVQEFHIRRRLIDNKQMHYIHTLCMQKPI